MNKIQPSFDQEIGYCTANCPSYDGKRCRLIGFENRGICEPWVRLLLDEKKEMSHYISDNTPLQSDDYTRGYDYAWNECIKVINEWLEEKEKKSGSYYEDVQKLYDKI